MRKKGFTLVELLGVIVLIAIILVLVLPAVSSILGEGEETVYSAQISKILEATYDYTIKNINLLPEYQETNFITLNELKKNDFIDSDIVDPITRELFPDDLVISIKNVGSNYKASQENSMLNGYYLYKVETEFMNTEEFLSNKPTISFVGHDKTPIVFNVNIGDEYTELEYSALSSSDADLTSKVVVNITYNSKRVDVVDTSKVGIYYINYSVVDENGYSTNEKVSIIVNDTQIPKLSIPDNTTISKDATSFDLKNGVTCIDNSGKCEVDMSGKINFGVTGKYIIEYKAYDPSGNTTISKRVITVE